MAYSRYNQTYEQFKHNPTMLKAQNNGSELIRNACLNNDRLLRQYKISFACQIRELASKGITMNRRTYEMLRKGDRKSVNTTWIGYLHSYWAEKGYGFTLIEFCGAGFRMDF